MQAYWQASLALLVTFARRFVGKTFVNQRQFGAASIVYPFTVDNIFYQG
jgi:hypothetical protein